MKQQPSHPDFWLMAEVVQDLDAAAEDRVPIETIVKDLDKTSVAYVALQRALRAQTMLPGGPRDAMAPLWFEGFIMGVMYQRRKDQR
jgi:hypothetical protein